MPLTSEDRKLRDEVKQELVEMIESNKIEALDYINREVKNKENKDITPAVRGDVLAMCIDLEILEPEEIESGLVADVTERWLKDAPWRERDIAADKGTKVHKLAELMAQGEKVDVPEYLEGHINSWYALVDKYEIEFLETEFTVFDIENDYAGCGDFIAKFHARPHWGIVLGDYKTSISGIYPDVSLQLSALRYAKFIARCNACIKRGPCKDGNHPREALWEDRSVLSTIKTTVGVQLLANGFHVVPARTSMTHFNTFLSGRNVAKWKTSGEQMALDTDIEPEMVYVDGLWQPKPKKTKKGSKK